MTETNAAAWNALLQHVSRQGMWTSGEVLEGIEKWLKHRRAVCDQTDERAIDMLLDELRDCAVEGWFPWQQNSVKDG